MREDDFIVSKTNTKGIITYGNRTFIEFSGYSAQELIGTNHNIIRHPDMPRAAFKLLWDTISTGKEFFAYVKNLAKDGSFYWVFANVTPDFDANGKIIGYFSVRRKPKESAIQAVSELYRLMVAEEQRLGGRAGMEGSTALLLKILADKGMSYEELVLGL
ncbi:MAG TPA: PAS domain-containing protein [Pantanalinema sp.]